MSKTFSEEYDDYCQYLSAKKIPTAPMDPQSLGKHARTLQDIARLYRSILKRLKPSVVFQVSFYSPEGMGLNLACRGLHIPSVDIQHGFQGDLHAAYGRWNKVPDSGYELLPSYFWCWTDREVAAINNWSAPVSSWHQPFVGGNLWLNEWQTGKKVFVERYDMRIKALLDRYPAHHHIIVTLQPGLADKTTIDNLVQAMKRGDPKWRWWVRLHPCMLSERQKVRELLVHNAVTDFDLDTATDLPLYALLRHMDLHVTYSSSTVIEASLFGVPSVIIGELGSEFFKEQIESGWAVMACATKDIMTAIKNQLTPQARSQKTKPVNPAPEKELETILSSIQQWKKNR